MSEDNNQVDVTQGRTLELFFVNGKPSGILIAEVFGWTGHILKTSRTQIYEALKRDKSKYTGVYILLGESKTGSPLAYIGEGDDISSRIKSHIVDKDWWENAVFITAQTNVLTKTHSSYLETRLIKKALNAKKIELDNGKIPTLPSLKESEIANIESFLADVLMVLPAIGINMFEQDKRPQMNEERGKSEVHPIELELKTPKHKLHAFAVIKDDEFVVLEGSTARLKWEGKNKWDITYKKLHNDLVKNQILVKDGDQRRFTQNVVFSSSSAAGAVVNGRPTAGPSAWKLKGKDTTYKEWDAKRLEKE